MVKSLISILSARQSSILSGASVLMVAVFVTKFLGLLRDRLLFHKFDTSTTDIFFGAFKLPDLLFQLLVFGALSVAFIPIFTDYLNKKGEEEAFEFASNILNLLLLVFIGVALVAAFFTPLINSLILPGFTGEKKILTDQATQIILIAQFLLIIGSFFIAIGQSYQRFIIPALASIFYNLGIIIGITIFSPSYGILGPVIGVVLGAILHILIQIPLVRSLGFSYKLSFSMANQGVREIFRLMSMRNIGLIAEQVSEVVATGLASLIANSSVTLLTVAQHLYLVPISLFGLTISQAALPVLAREQSHQENESFKLTLLTTMHQILFLTLPAAAILIVLRIPIVRFVFGASKFSWGDTVLTGKAIAFFAIGLAAQALIQLLVRGFYALKDTKTPVFVSLTTVFINIILSFIFIIILKLDVWSLGLASAVASNVGFFLLITFLHRKVGGFDFNKLTFPALKMFLAAVTAAVALYIPIKALDQLVFDTTKTANLLILTGIASFLGLSVYIVLVWLMKVKELETFVNLFKKIGQLQSKIESSEIVDQTSDGVS